MSLFRTIESPCPTCSVLVSFDLVHSVNADRRPALRAQLLDRSFQRETCPSCGEKFRTEPEFTYLHMGARQFLSVWPASKLSQWATCERRSLESFDRFYGPAASPAASAIGKDLTVRVAFGWEAAREKLVAAEVGIDDHSLELAKLLLIRSGEVPLPDEESELRLLEEDADHNLAFGQFAINSEALGDVFTVPRALLDEIEAAPEDWQELRDQLSAGPFVDMARLMIEPAEARAA